MRGVLSPFSHVRLFVTPLTVAHQAPLFVGFSRQEYWSVLPFPSPGYLSNPGIKPWSPTLQTYSLPSEPPGIPRNDTNAWARRPTPLRFFPGFSSKLLRAYYMLFVCHSVHTFWTSVDIVLVLNLAMHTKGNWGLQRPINLPKVK